MTAIDYCTLAEVETYAGINFSDGIGPTDDEIATMITNASRMVDAYAGRQLAGTETHVEYQDSTERMRHLVLRNRPVVSVASLEETKSDGSTTTLVEGRTRGDSDWWLDDAQSGIIRFHNAAGLKPCNCSKSPTRRAARPHRLKPKWPPSCWWSVKPLVPHSTTRTARSASRRCGVHSWPRRRANIVRCLSVSSAIRILPLPYSGTVVLERGGWPASLRGPAHLADGAY